jgi:signal transduction histidine kinase
MHNCIQTMKKNTDNPELQERYLELLAQGVERIRSTVRQLLNIGRKEPLEIKCGDVDSMIRDCLELTCLGRRTIALELNLGVQKPVWVWMEALRQVMLNLAGNAVQAMGEKGGVLKVSSRVSGSDLVVEVGDSGPGIAPEHMDKIFEPFFTTKEVGEGTGLGLSVSYSLIRRMGGELSARNAEPSGAVFTLRVPLTDSRHETGEGGIS